MVRLAQRAHGEPERPPRPLPRAEQATRGPGVLRSELWSRRHHPRCVRGVGSRLRVLFGGGTMRPVQYVGNVAR